LQNFGLRIANLEISNLKFAIHNSKFLICWRMVNRQRLIGKWDMKLDVPGAGKLNNGNPVTEPFPVAPGQSSHR
jgi:hypothetical protein